MNEFRKYMHVERLGTREVEGILEGVCLIFSKIDGTNSQVFWNKETNEINAGSRNRILSLESDNAGFYRHIKEDVNITKFLSTYPDYIIYSEWLKPHSLRTYIDDAWSHFYVFDVYNTLTERYLSYEEYSKLLDEYNIEYIKLLTTRVNPTLEDLQEDLQNNKYLIKEGEGIGEGIVIKNYEFVNKYGRTTWAKMIADTFDNGVKRKLVKLTVLGELEVSIVDKYVTSHLVEKVYAKIAIDGWESKMIERLLETVFHDLINEEMYDILKKFKNPIINFKSLKTLTILKIKELKKELFS